MRIRKIVVDSDIIIDHLVTGNKRSVLRILMEQYFCYTTVFNAIEVFSYAKSKKELETIGDAMSAMKILGLNAKSAKNIGGLFARDRSLTGLIAGVCVESKLPIVTRRGSRFKKAPKVKVIPVKDLIN